MVVGHRFSARSRCKRLALDAKRIYGRFEGRPPSDFSTSVRAETESSFQHPNGGRQACILYCGRIGSRWVRVHLWGYRHISTSAVVVNGVLAKIRVRVAPAATTGDSDH